MPAGPKPPRLSSTLPKFILVEKMVVEIGSKRIYLFKSMTCISKLAEGEGFEPSEGLRPSTVFETAPFNHSGTPPRWCAYTAENAA